MNSRRMFGRKVGSSAVKVSKSLLLWLVFVPVSIVNGGVRECLLAPVWGEQVALPVSGVTLSLLIALTANLLLPRIGRLTMKEACCVAGLWLVLTVVFEFVLGMSSQVPFEELLAAYNPGTGNLWLLVLFATTMSPILVTARENKKERS